MAVKPQVPVGSQLGSAPSAAGEGPFLMSSWLRDFASSPSGRRMTRALRLHMAVIS